MTFYLPNCEAWRAHVPTKCRALSGTIHAITQSFVEMTDCLYWGTEAPSILDVNPRSDSTWSKVDRISSGYNKFAGYVRGEGTLANTNERAVGSNSYHHLRSRWAWMRRLYNIPNCLPKKLYIGHRDTRHLFLFPLATIIISQWIT